MYILPPISDWGVWRGTPLEVVCNNHSPAPIYEGYLPRTGVYCGVWSATWCCQCLLHLAYMLAICMCCGLHLAYVLALCMCFGAWRAPGAVYVLAICIVGCLACT